MKKILLGCMVILALLASTSPVFADDYNGWDTIRPSVWSLTQLFMVTRDSSGALAKSSILSPAP